MDKSLKIALGSRGGQPCGAGRQVHRLSYYRQTGSLFRCPGKHHQHGDVDRSYRTLRENARTLMDEAAPAEELERIRAAISTDATDAIEAHALRTRGPLSPSTSSRNTRRSIVEFWSYDGFAGCRVDE